MKAADGTPLHVVATGPASQVTILLAHGWTLDETCWAPVAEILRGHRVVRFDHRGHGRSGAVDPSTMTLEQLADDMAAVITQAAPSGPLVIAGHSMGGMTAMALAERHPDLVADRVAGLALVATASGGLGDLTLGLPPRLSALVGAGEQRLYGSKGWAAREALSTHPRLLTPGIRWLLLGPHPDREALRTTTDVIAHCRPQTVSGFRPTLSAHERDAALAAYARVPVHIMAGTKDRLTPPRFARRIREGLPDAELTIFPDAGHMLPLERTAGVAARIEALARTAAATRAA
ncbi:alpha/beta hydrolase [Pseudonocardia ailaonensis]|uniref:Alpha/beta hydrolase n=1 Tax=Pseudonocardia ailaonensis TaxID=367279 RepID=A0ABN2MY87_9PSEU